MSLVHPPVWSSVSTSVEKAYISKRHVGFHMNAALFQELTSVGGKRGSRETCCGSFSRLALLKEIKPSFQAAFPTWAFSPFL
ncbi:hypothetical protein E2320_004077 [Naja naja]|nr:hypothetical protein E2320_004077 [Naja naja]